MTKLEKRLIKLVIDDINGAFGVCEVNSTLDDCYKTYSYYKERAYYDDVCSFSSMLKDVEKSAGIVFFTFTRIVSFNKMFFTMLQCGYFVDKTGTYAILRYDTPSKTIIRGFRMGADGFKFVKSINDIFNLFDEISK